MVRPLISIVIPVFNRADVVMPTLRSVGAQTLRPLEVVLVDNNSTDGSLRVLNDWAAEASKPDFQVKVISETAQGAGAARNAGLREASAEWTMFFDSDDLMSPDHCSRAYEAAQSSPAPDIVGWDLYVPGPGGSRRFRPFVTRDMIRANIFESIFSTQHYMARTELFRQAGGWRTDARIAEDVELGHRLLMLDPVCARMPSRGETVTVVPEPQSLMRAGSQRIADLRPALEAIRANLPSGQRHLIDLQYLCAACGWASADPDAPTTVKEIIARQPRIRRLLWRLLYQYGRHGGRGIGRIYRLLTH